MNSCFKCLGIAAICLAIQPTIIMGDEIKDEKPSSTTIPVPIPDQDSNLCQTTVSLPDIAAGQRSAYTLLLTNETSEVLEITSGKASCSCTDIQLPPQKIPPGEAGVCDIGVALSPSDPRVVSHVEIYLTTKGKYSLVKVNMQMSVSHVAAFIPPSVNFSAAKRAKDASNNEQQTFYIPIAFSAPYSEKDIKFSASDDLVDMSWKVVQVDGKWFAAGTCNLADIPPTGLNGVVQLNVKDRKQNSECRISIANPPDFDFTPPAVKLYPDLEEGEKSRLVGSGLVRISRNVVSENKGGTFSASMEGDYPGLSLRTEKVSSAIYRVFFEFDSSVKGGPPKQQYQLQFKYGSASSKANIEFE